MKILFVSAILPYPLESGGQVRVYNLLKTLGKKHDITLYAFIRSNIEKVFVSRLPFCRKVVTVLRGRVWQPKYLFGSMLGTYPLLWQSYHNSEMLSLLATELTSGEYDLIHIEPGYVSPSVPKEVKAPVVVAEHNVEHTIYDTYVRQFRVLPLRPFMGLDVMKMKFWESRVWRQAGKIVAVSNDDKKQIEQVSARADVAVVPNGVDTKTFAFRPKKILNTQPQFLYVGNFRWMENRDALSFILDSLWPAITKAYPGARLTVVGKHAPKIKHNGSITMNETVGNLASQHHKADIMLAPIRIGGGTKFKILESFATGLAVVTSPLGIEGLEINPGRHALVATTPAGYLAAIEKLYDNQSRLVMTQNARKLVETKYSWEPIADALEKVWESTQ